MAQMMSQSAGVPAQLSPSFERIRNAKISGLNQATRILQRNRIYVVGIPLELGNEEALKDFRHFGQYGMITNIKVNPKYYLKPLKGYCQKAFIEYS